VWCCPPVQPCNRFDVRRIGNSPYVLLAGGEGLHAPPDWTSSIRSGKRRGGKITVRP
jgi:hypothetical protein